MTGNQGFYTDRVRSRRPTFGVTFGVTSQGHGLLVRIQSDFVMECLSCHVSPGRPEECTFGSLGITFHVGL